MGRRLAMIWIVLCGSLAAWARDTSKPFDLLPDYVKVQYAGSIGFVSVGAGYQNRKEKLEADLYYGYVPKSVGGVEIHALSGKLTWYPLKKKTVKSLELRPLALGGLVSYTFGQQYFLFSPEHYPFSYYKFPTAMHTGVFVGSRLDKRLPSGRKVGLYYELGSNDREIISYILNNKSLKITDILHLGVGVKTSF